MFKMDDGRSSIDYRVALLFIRYLIAKGIIPESLSSVNSNLLKLTIKSYLSRTDVRTDGGTDGRMDGRMDGRTDIDLNVEKLRF